MGRDRETATALGLVCGALVVIGEPGAGKSTLLGMAADAATPGRRVLRASGSRSESIHPYSGLHQLMRPVLGEIDRLPERQRSALLGAIGLDDTPDRMMVAVAVLTLLSELSEQVPVLAVVDDIGLLDDSSRDVLAFVARRIGDESLAILVSAQDETEFPGFDRIVLDPLEVVSAAALLDAQPSVPTGRLRSRVLAQAAGNPLALIELARAGSDDTILPLTDRLERIYAADLAILPAETRSALLLIAADTSDLIAASWSSDLEPAEKAGLIRFFGSQVRFRHPLVRSAIYHSATLAARLEAHRTLAELFIDEPDRRAWHLAEATVAPDEDVAAVLEEAAIRAQQRGAHSAAAATFERAAELSPLPHDRARRLVIAAGAAVLAGQATWVEQLAKDARTLTDDPSLVATAALRVGQALSLTYHHDGSLELLMRAADEPSLTAQALSAAAVGTFYSGDEHDRAMVRARSEGDPWVAALVDPHTNRADSVARIPELLDRAGDDAGALTSIAVMAWLLDETALAVQIFDNALHRQRTSGEASNVLNCSAGWAYLDHGLWAQARLAAAGARASAVETSLPQLTAGNLVLEATAMVLTGESDIARELVDSARSMIDPRTSKAVLSRAFWVLGMADVADGNHSAAYEQFRQLFTAEGKPIHYYFSSVAVAELVAAAVRSGHEAEAADILDSVEKGMLQDPSPRIYALLHRSHALLDHDGAEVHFQRALQDRATEQWPFERAQVLLDYGEWLRRRRRILEARPLLATANEAFRRLGAQSWLGRAQGELRAAGIDSEPGISDALRTLSPQQQQIIRLAARGLTNREIGERLFISPRTVSSHLYRSYPTLRISSRAQLRDIVQGVTWPAHTATS